MKRNLSKVKQFPSSLAALFDNFSRFLLPSPFKVEYEFVWGLVFLNLQVIMILSGLKSFQLTFSISFLTDLRIGLSALLICS
jgi:hypothetical protein